MSEACHCPCCRLTSLFCVHLSQRKNHQLQHRLLRRFSRPFQTPRVRRGSRGERKGKSAVQTPLNQRTKSNFQEALRSGWQSSRTEAVEGSARASLQCRPTVLPSPGLAPTSEILVSTELVCRLPESTRRQSRGAQRLVLIQRTSETVFEKRFAVAGNLRAPGPG